MNFATILIAAVQVAAAPQAMPTQVDWRAAPVAQGSWVWRSIPGGSEALFQGAAGVQLSVRCNMANRTVTFVRGGAVPGSTLTVRTTSQERVLPPSATLGARDPLLDALAFSRGRFAIEGGGAVRLVVPAWPEAARSIEDCRK